MELIFDPHGNWVVKEVLRQLPPSRRHGIVTSLRGSETRIAKHAFGCSVLARLIEFGSGEQVRELFCGLAGDLVHLVEHLYASVVVRALLENSEHRIVIVKALLPRIHIVVYHEFGYRVLACMVRLGDPFHKVWILNSFLFSRGAKSLEANMTLRY